MYIGHLQHCGLYSLLCCLPPGPLLCFSQLHSSQSMSRWSALLCQSSLFLVAPTALFACSAGTPITEISTDPLMSHEIKVRRKESEWVVDGINHFRESGRTPFCFRKTFLHRLGAFTAIADSIATAAPQMFMHVCKGMIFRHVGEHVCAVESAEPFMSTWPSTIPANDLGDTHRTR